jgi:hypothetical protein
VLVLNTMAVDAQGDEVLRGVVSQHAAKFPVMDLHVSTRPAQLASPSIPMEYAFAKKAILFQIQFQSGFPLTQSAHKGFKIHSHLQL